MQFWFDLSYRKFRKGILYTYNEYLCSKLWPSKSTLLILRNHLTSIPLTWKRTHPRVRLVQLLIIWMIYKQISHVKSVGDILIVWQLEHIRLSLIFLATQNGLYFHFSNFVQMPGKWVCYRCAITKSPS